MTQVRPAARGALITKGEDEGMGGEENYQMGYGLGEREIPAWLC